VLLTYKLPSYSTPGSKGCHVVSLRHARHEFFRAFDETDERMLANHNQSETGARTANVPWLEINCLAARIDGCGGTGCVERCHAAGAKPHIAVDRWKP
jgi:hypothetical protein